MTSELKNSPATSECHLVNNRQILFEVNKMLANKPKTKILVDGGDPEETLRGKELLGLVDGQTTNPSLIATNREIQQQIVSGHTLSPQEEKDEYRKIVQAISPLIGDAGVSIEVFADIGTTAEEMLAQGEEMFSWIPNAYIKYPIHIRRLAGGGNVAAQTNARQYDTVFFAGTSGSRTCCDKRIGESGLCIALRRQARRSRRKRYGGS